MTGFKVIKSGFLTLLEDQGRFGFSDRGICPSGVMDEYAYNMVNLLLNNPEETNVLEISFVGLTLQSTANTVICICGANFGLKINNTPAPLWKSIQIKKDDIIEFTQQFSGQRAYLGVKDGFMIPKEFNSNSTTLKENIGGLNGQAIKNGDFLPFNASKVNINNQLKESMIPTYKKELTLRVVMGYQEKYFTQEDKELFFTQNYTITTQFNRMGCKLKGIPISPKGGDIISEGICFGAIQIPKDGQPIILLKERQTIGGYPKIGSVLSIDCYSLAQMQPTMTINFKKITLSEAQIKLKLFNTLFKPQKNIIF